MGHRRHGAPIAMTTPRKRRRRKGGVLGRLSETFTDPRAAGGSIDQTTRLIDPERGVLLERVAVAEIGMERDGRGELVAAIEVAGKLNTVGEEARLLLIATPDAAALLVSQIVGLSRSGRFGPEFAEHLERRMKEAAG